MATRPPGSKPSHRQGSRGPPSTSTNLLQTPDVETPTAAAVGSTATRLSANVSWAASVPVRTHHPACSHPQPPSLQLRGWPCEMHPSLPSPSASAPWSPASRSLDSTQALRPTTSSLAQCWKQLIKWHQLRVSPSRPAPVHALRPALTWKKTDQKTTKEVVVYHLKYFLSYQSEYTLASCVMYALGFVVIHVILCYSNIKDKIINPESIPASLLWRIAEADTGGHFQRPLRML